MDEKEVPSTTSAPFSPSSTERILTAKSNISTTSSTTSPKRIPSYAELGKSSPQSPPKSASSPLSSSSFPPLSTVTDNENTSTNVGEYPIISRPNDEEEENIPPVEINMAIIRDALGGETNEETLLSTHTIHLEWCNITLIGDTLSLMFHNLRDLYLQHNFITRLEGLELLQNLEFLAIGGNRIETIENISHLTKLKVLDIHSNRIHQLIKNTLPLSIRIFHAYDNPISQQTNYENYLTLVLDMLPECIQLDHTDIDRPSYYKATLYEDVSREEENQDNDDNDQQQQIILQDEEENNNNNDTKENDPIDDDDASHNHSPNSKGGSVSIRSYPSTRKNQPVSSSPSYRVSGTPNTTNARNNNNTNTTSPGSITSSHSILRESTVSPTKTNEKNHIDIILNSIQDLQLQPSLKPDYTVSKEGTIATETKESLQRYTSRRMERTNRIQLRVDKESVLSGELNKAASDVGEQQLQEARQRLETLRNKITDRTKQRQTETNQWIERQYNPQTIHDNTTTNTNTNTNNTDTNLALQERLAQVRDWRSLLNP